MWAKFNIFSMNRGKSFEKSNRCTIRLKSNPFDLKIPLNKTKILSFQLSNIPIKSLTFYDSIIINYEATAVNFSIVMISTVCDDMKGIHHYYFPTWNVYVCLEFHFKHCFPQRLWGCLAILALIVVSQYL